MNTSSNPEGQPLKNERKMMTLEEMSEALREAFLPSNPEITIRRNIPNPTNLKETRFFFIPRSEEKNE